MPASITDVAKKAGVSVTTVSRAINDHPYVSKQTKDRIKAVMEELNYYPNHVAQQLRGHKSKLIGVTISFITNQFFAYLVDAIEKKAKEMGYRINILQTSENPELEDFYLDLIAKKQMDGLIVTSIGEATPKLKKLLKEKKVVLCNRYLGEEPLDMIRIDEEEACYEGTKLLIEKGHKTIAFCTGNHRDPSFNDKRYKGFYRAMEDAGLSFNMDHYFAHTMGIEGGRYFAKEWMNMTDDRPTAVFSNGDLTAAGIINELQENGYRVPEDLAVLGFDDQPIAGLTKPGITTIAQPIQEMGELVTEILIHSLEDNDIPAYQTLKTKLIIRGSV
ncbi:LacI family DNA-binding transcriptional regulator [Streptococcus cameli]